MGNESGGLPGKEAAMHYSDYLREEASRYRRLAACARESREKQEYLELAQVCEEVAMQIDDLRSSG